MSLLEPNENLPEHLLSISKKFSILRDDLLNAIQTDTPEVTAGLRKILEAKDCFVRAAHEIASQAKDAVHDVTASDDPPILQGGNPPVGGTIPPVTPPVYDPPPSDGSGGHDL